MTKYQPIIQYCQKRILELQHNRDVEVTKILAYTDSDNFEKNELIAIVNKAVEGTVGELFKIISLCERLDEQEKMLLESLVWLPKV